MFKKGDKILCIDNSNNEKLQVSCVYTIYVDQSDAEFVAVCEKEGYYTHYYAHRFILVTSTALALYGNTNG